MQFWVVCWQINLELENNYSGMLWMKGIYTQGFMSFAKADCCFWPSFMYVSINLCTIFNHLIYFTFTSSSELGGYCQGGEKGGIEWKINAVVCLWFSGYSYGLELDTAVPPPGHSGVPLVANDVTMAGNAHAPSFYRTGEVLFIFIYVSRWTRNLPNILEPVEDKLLLLVTDNKARDWTGGLNSAQQLLLQVTTLLAPNNVTSSRWQLQYPRVQ